ncbi:hypothetical protein P3S72_07105 [Pseudomonas sp. D3]|uniref:hypothetical protein n=1 Tax=Pseudomonas sp. D3 TaxID=517398 RepID=UPI0023E359C6|nr:hypothetical protein [Pseudomonas sp. D3]WET11892.1 hypothetical protein P3S72_07105 [Pseudomonas sp. D3]
MGFNDHGNEDLRLAYDDLINEGLIDPSSDEAGVARQVIEQGFDSMSPKQKHIYEARFEPVLVLRAKRLEVQRVIDSNPG